MDNHQRRHLCFRGLKHNASASSSSPWTVIAKEMEMAMAMELARAMVVAMAMDMATAMVLDMCEGREAE
eukprot:10465895-Alexandrium_andersonii.AAC.1